LSGSEYCDKLGSNDKKAMQYVILTPQQLMERLDTIHPNVKSLQSYLWVTKDNGAGRQCRETRSFKKAQTDALLVLLKKLDALWEDDNGDD